MVRVKYALGCSRSEGTVFFKLMQLWTSLTPEPRKGFVSLAVVLGDVIASQVQELCACCKLRKESVWIYLTGAVTVVVVG